MVSYAGLPVRIRPVVISYIGHGVEDIAIALNTLGEAHITDRPEICRPRPCGCGCPISRASLRLLHSGSCSMLPVANPNSET